MHEFFSSLVNQNMLKKEIEYWLGTPYQHMGYSRSGIDCTKFIGKVLVNLGILRDFDKKVYYPPDWYIHGNEEICLKAIETTIQQYLIPNLYIKKLQYTDFNCLMVGDLICISKNLKGLVNHTAIYLGNNQIAHCLNIKGVFIGQFSFFYAQKTKCLFRLFYKD